MSDTARKQVGQSARFERTARELDCDDDEAHFDERMKRLHLESPRPEEKKKPDHKK